MLCSLSLSASPWMLWPNANLNLLILQFMMLPPPRHTYQAGFLSNCRENIATYISIHLVIQKDPMPRKAKVLYLGIRNPTGNRDSKRFFPQVSTVFERNGPTKVFQAELKWTETTTAWREGVFSSLLISKMLFSYRDKNLHHLLRGEKVKHSNLWLRTYCEFLTGKGKKFINWGTIF